MTTAFGSGLRSVQGIFKMMRHILSRTAQGLKQCQQQIRGMSSAQSYVQVTTDEKTGVATVSMNRKPVNSLSYEMLTELALTFEKLDTTSSGIILTSSMNSVFCAGLDIQEMYQPTKEKLSAFWRSLQDMYIKLYGTSRPVIAAINGHAPAGGVFCLYCVTTGLWQKGIVAPFWFIDAMERVIGHHATCRALQLGHMFSSEEALHCRLVDRLVPQEQVVETAQKEMLKWIRIPDHARQLTKMSMRKPVLDNFLARRDAELEFTVNFIMKDSIQKAIGFYLESLKKKGK